MEDSKEKKPYRPCVVGVFINEKKELLMGLRSDFPVWQFPQGGVDQGESFEEALFREMEEELGCNQFEVLSQTGELLFYDFPKELKAPVTKLFRGQKQRWFLCRFLAGKVPNLEKATSDEFTAVKWVAPENVLDSIVIWKKETYRIALTSLGILP